MILIGQYDSPFVRRVGVALHIYDLRFEHRPWSVFGDAEQVRAFNPLTRVPTVVLEDGEVLIESAAILDYLDELVGPEKALMPDGGPDRRRALKISALATGLAEKSVSLFYDQLLHKEPSVTWASRCHAQISGVLDVLEAGRVDSEFAFWFGNSIGHADIAIACALRYLGEAHATFFNKRQWPALAEHSARCEALRPFQEITQPFLPPS